MNIEKTIEFILDQQAKTEALWQRNEERWQRNEERWQHADERWQHADERWQRAEERSQRAEERMVRLEKRQERFDKSLNGDRKLIVMGMKMVNQVTASHKAAQVELSEIRGDIRGLTAAQKRTDQKFERLVELLSRRSPNGHR